MTDIAAAATAAIACACVRSERVTTKAKWMEKKASNH